MTNYVIINGTNSNTITGLAINELPPITKPLMRTEKEEIDGRDGDIITKLGYSAYDKTITIGLWGTGYDVNSIISFFNKEGTITFSNEADKYYNFTMLEQFDIESLLRFKTATITFHCQPFKYPTTETPIEIEYEYIEQDNVESATLNNTNGNTHLDISLKGNTSQYTTTGKNLLNLGNMSGTSNQVQYSVNSNGELILNGTCNSDRVQMPLNNLSLNGTYTFSHNLAKSIAIKDSSNKNIFITDNYVSNTVNNTATSMIIYTASGTVFNNKKIQLQIETGNQATIWEQYSGGIPAPNPDYPQPINVVSGDNTINVCGDNLLNIQALVKGRIDSGVLGYAYATSNLTLNDDSFSFTTTEGYRGVATDYMLVEELTDYVLSYTSTDTLQRLCDCYDSNKNWLGRVWFEDISTNNQKITTLANTRYVRVSWQLNAVGTGTITKPIFKKSSVAIEYEPYQSQTYHITLPNGMELCKIGDYQDYFTKNSSGQWCKYNAIGKVVLDGSETWNRTGTSTSGNYYFFINNLLSNVLFDSNNRFTGMSNIGITTNAWQGVQGVDTILYNSNKTTRVYTETTKTMSVDDFKTWLGSNNTIVYYVLATPYLSLIEDTTLINQLDNIRNAMSYEGQTNVSQVNNDKPFIMDLIAMKDGTDEVIVNNIGNTTSKPTIALEGTGDINIYLDGTQMLKATLTDKMTIDTNNLEAYNPDTMTLLNRQLVGDISKFTLASGNNTIKVDGNLTKATITNYTRWL